MRVAIDKYKNRIYASEEAKKTECFCQSCGEKVKPRVGKINIPHFAHSPQSECSFGKDKDSKSEWHIRMQDYFPIEAQEVRFTDETNGQIHIADVVLKESNTVLEFQHSPITPEEFYSRTAFHIKSGRRIVWVFDESSTNSKTGRFRVDELERSSWPYIRHRWLYSPRKCLNFGPDLNSFNDKYSVCVYVGGEDILYRIVCGYNDFESVDFSFHLIQMAHGMNVKEFFTTDEEWSKEEPYKEIFDAYKEQLRIKQQASNSTNTYHSRTVSRRNFCL